ncbi:MAG: secretin and TonB N-terminal domain-containing protein, partial [Candidatus Doudnabacteria bacterium]|nr:secretin and TonB N-terminal domain-containing protein [Candidatus Doudnabacteria bacterium]
MGAETGLNIVTGPGIKGKVTVSLKDVSPFEALKAVIKASGYDFSYDNNIVKVSAPEYKDRISQEQGIITKTFALNYISPDD